MVRKSRLYMSVVALFSVFALTISMFWAAAPLAHAATIQASVLTVQSSPRNNILNDIVLRISEDAIVDKLIVESKNSIWPQFSNTSIGLALNGNKVANNTQITSLSSRGPARIEINLNGKKISKNDTLTLTITAALDGSDKNVAGYRAYVEGTATSAGASSEGSSAAQISTSNSSGGFTTGSSPVAFIETTAKELGLLNEIRIQTNADSQGSFDVANLSSLKVKVGEHILSPSEYKVSIEDSKLSIILNSFINVENGTSVRVEGFWTNGSFSGAMTLWKKLSTAPPVPDPNNSNRSFPPLLDTDPDYIKMKQGTDYTVVNSCHNYQSQREYKANWISRNKKIGLIRLEALDNITQGNKDAVKVWYNKKYLTVGSGISRVEIKGKHIYIFLEQPLVFSGETKIFAYTPLEMGMCAYMNLFEVAPRQEIPTQCKQENHISQHGHVIPPMGNGGPIVSKQPRRELTPEEKRDGTRVYVTASRPDGQRRYKTQLSYQLNAGTNFVNIGKETGWVVNALAFNKDDNWLYGISQPRYGDHTVPTTGETVPLEDPCFPAGHLLQINPADGTVYDLGKITAPGTTAYGISGGYNRPWPNDLWGGVNVGFFDNDGKYWVTNASLSGSRALYKVDIDTRVAEAKASTSVRGSSFDPWYANSEDYAVLPKEKAQGNYAWGIENGWLDNYGRSGQEKRIYIERLNLDTGEKDKFDITDLRTSSGMKVDPGHQWGKAWVYGNGNLGFGTASSGATAHGLQIQVLNPDSKHPDFVLVSVNTNVPQSYNSNGTSSGILEPEVDLRAHKEVLSNELGTNEVKWRVIVENLSEISSSSFTLNEILPFGYSAAKIELDKELTSDSMRNIDMLVQTNKDSTGIQVIFGKLAPSSKVVLTVTANRPAENYCDQNLVEVVSNEKDPNPGNNIATASICGLKLEKTAIDIDGNQQIDSEDSKTEVKIGTATYKTVKYDLAVKNEGFDKRTYELTDAPAFTNDVTPKFYRVQIKDNTGREAKILNGPTQWFPISANYDPDSQEYKEGSNLENQPDPLTISRAISRVQSIEISPGDTHYYEVEIAFVMRNKALNPEGAWEHLKCESAAGPKTPREGLYNKGYLKDMKNGKILQDDDCVPVDQNRPPHVKLNKVDAEDMKTPLDGAKFKICPVEGEILNCDKPLEMLQEGEYANSYEINAGRYAIIETQAPGVTENAPQGYELLPAPVYFEANLSQGGYSIALLEQVNGKLEQSKNNPLVNVDKDEANLNFVINIGDVRTGTMPLTGSTGYLPVAALGMMLLASAGVYGRRKVLR